MKIITSNDVLLRFVPNVFATVEGEKDLFEKIEHHLMAAEQWTVERFVPSEVMDAVATDDTYALLRRVVASCITSEALYRAVPSLDLVLTPNGFGIVSNQNVAPASKERVERLLYSLQSNRDKAIEMMLKLLPDVPQWKDSAPFRFFYGTMFPNFDFLYEVGIADRLWANYLAMRSRVVLIESLLAERFFSPEETAFWHTVEDPDTCQTLAIAQYHAIIVNTIKENKIPEWACYGLVEHIKTNPESFTRWHNSDTAQLFAPPVFRNEKKSSGYWF